MWIHTNSFNTAFFPSYLQLATSLNSDYFVLMNIKHLALYALLPMILLLAACEDLLKKDLDIKQADYPPKLSVTAVLDADMSFKLWLSEAKSLASFDGSIDESVQRVVSVKLYEDDSPIFDYCRMVYFGGASVYFGGTTSVYLDTVVVEMQQGNTYKLTVEVDGYETVTSTAVMPDMPIIDQVSIDIFNMIQKKNVIEIESLNSGGGYWGGYSDSYYGIKLSLADNSPLPDYYSFEVQPVFKSHEQTTSTDYPIYLPKPDIGVSNTVLVQDNPDVEAIGFLGDLGESYDLYLFDLMLISDISFSGKTANLDLFMPKNEMVPFYYQQKDRVPDYNPDRDGEEIVPNVDVNLLVKHITKETFRHYRTLAMQNQGLGFFSEPVSVSTNIENGLGCFSLCNSRQILLYESVYYYGY